MTPRRAFLGGCALGAVAAWVVPFGAILAATWLAPGWFANLRAGQLPPPPVWSQGAAPLDWAVESFAGTPESLDNHPAAVLVLHFWRPGCLACRAEIPGLNALHAALAGSSSAVVGVVVGDFEEAAALVAGGEVHFPQVIRRAPPPPPFDVGATPSTYVLGPDRQVAFRHQGAARWDAPEVIAFVDALAQAAPNDH